MPLDIETILRAVMRHGLMDEEAAELARGDVRRRRIDPMQALSVRGRLPTSSIYHALADELKVEFVGRVQISALPELVARLPAALIHRRMVLPIAGDNGEAVCAVADIDALGDHQLIEILRRALDKPVRLALADPADLAPHIRRAVGTSAPAAPGSELSDNAVQFVREMMRLAYVNRASDIHIEPGEEEYLIRIRVDGRLQPLRSNLSPALGLAVLSRLKVLAGLDIAENREPQDGSLIYELTEADGRSFDIRMATAPTKHGERATLRLLGADSRALTLEELGFSDAMRRRFNNLIRRPSGLILLTGPTGSGKSTTLYAALRQITNPELNVMTVEDPVEYSIPGVSQIEVDGFGKVTFSSALRSLLRHDPDVLMVGEIRDRETADMALRAAATGHLVFSTLHTNSAIGAVARLADMGCEPYMIAATLLAVISQRLVRRLCPGCKTPRTVVPDDADLLGPVDSQSRVFEPVGCIRCQRTGFLGRTAIFELFEVDQATRQLISSRADESIIAQSANNLTTLCVDAAAKVLAGVTTAAEVRRMIVLEQ